LRLVEDASLRKSIGSAAKKLAFEKFSPQIGESILKETVCPFIKDNSVKKAKKRVLLVNVYFYPQSVGGATRVFENQVRGLIERYPDDYEVFVLTSEVDADIGKPYSVQQYWFDNVLVTRLNIPPRNWVDHDDVHVYNFCVQFFKEYLFDIIHVHSIQVLTASLVDAAITLKIPYIITLHDAWWLSIYQFLVNPKGELVDHTLPLGGVPEEEQNKDWIIKRRRRLQKVILKANAVVAVSKKFAQLYQQAGFNNVQVHENYVEPFANTESRHSISDKIILGFIGGMSPHKGYDLLKKALEEGHFANMQLIVINHALHSGEVHTSTWGETTVEFRAKAKQSEVAQLYAQFDVLLAPSIWPESYGLVTREALQAGLWVIASDRGAIGDCIIEGVNGNIVDVTDYLGLMNALKQLPAQLEKRYADENATSSAEAFVGETMDSHLQQLVTLYQTALGTHG
jgi:glycosyltransferase involved in cell wall biosynthesis